MSETPLVFVVDDDASIRRALARLLSCHGWRVQTFADAAEFLAAERPDVPACVVLDVRLRGLDGLELQDALARSERPIPVVFASGHGDVKSSVRAMKQGAVDFLLRPFTEDQLVSAVREALERDRRSRAERGAADWARSLVEALTPREREVFELVADGLLNKQIAARLGTVEKTVKVHRSRVMQKLQARSVVDLVRIAQRVPLAAQA